MQYQAIDPEHDMKELQRSKPNTAVLIAFVIILAVLLTVFFYCTVPGVAYIFGKKNKNVHSICIVLGALFLINSLATGFMVMKNL